MHHDTEEMVKTLLNARGLTAWESDFLDSLVDQIGDGRELSGRQKEMLARIWEDRT